MSSLRILLAVTVLIAAPPAIRPDRPVDTAEALAALRAARSGGVAEADALTGRPFRVTAPIAQADWSYDPTFGVLTYRPHPAFWAGSGDQRLASAIGFRLDSGGEPLCLVLAPAAFDWLMGGEGLAAVRIPVTPEMAADASSSLRLMIEGQIEPLDGRHAIACGAPGEGCVLGARIDDLVLVYGPAYAPHILARWDPASLE
jgi:hypothetical protein